MARAQAMLNRHLATAAGVAVVYARGGRRCVPTAWPGTEANAPDLAGAGDYSRVDREKRDFLVVASTLVLAGRLALPEPGDTVTETVPDGRRFKFEVRANGSEPAYRWADPQRTLLRVHTVPVGECE